MDSSERTDRDRLVSLSRLTQTLARHSDIRLTMNVHSHAQIHDLSAAVEGLPINRPRSKRPEAETIKATGTDVRPAELEQRCRFSIQNEKRFQ